MKHSRAIVLAGFWAIATPALAAEYADFLRDIASPYAQYRQALVLSSNKDNAEKAQQAVAQFTQGWERVATVYANDPPKPMAGIADFASKIRRPIEVGKDAQALLKDGKVARAHSVLEEIRYLLWDMRVRSGINALADRANDFHEAMEVILDHAAAAKTSEELVEVGNRYGSWFSIKWEEHALAGDIAPLRKEFDAAFAEGRKSVDLYLAALRSGDLDAAKKLSSGVKNAYKRLWALDPK